MTSGNMLGLLTARTSSVRPSPLMMIILLCEAALTALAATFAASAYFGRETPKVGPSVAWKAPTFASIALTHDHSSVDLHTLSRPIFSRIRRPQSAASPRALDPASPSPPARVSLKAIVKYRSLAKAFLTSANTPQGEWKIVGDKFESWTVHQIEQDGLAIRNGTQLLQYSLYPKIETPQADSDLARKRRRELK